MELLSYQRYQNFSFNSKKNNSLLLKKGNKNYPYKAIGIGLGPYNLSLMIMLEELGKKFSFALNNFLFIEKNSKISWHCGMMIPGSDMQVPFLKDLVTIRNPSSPYSFLSFIHAKGRMNLFLNLRSFYPSRQEFEEYLAWVAEGFQNISEYHLLASKVEPIYEGKQVRYLRVVFKNLETNEVIDRITENLVIGIGKIPYIPKLFNINEKSSYCFHSSKFIMKIKEYENNLKFKEDLVFIVVGNGQSSGDIVLHLLKTFPNAEVHIFHRNYSYRLLDDNPFSNELYYPEAVDWFYSLESESRRVILENYKNTNYSVVSSDVLSSIFKEIYASETRNKKRFFIHRLAQINKVLENSRNVEVNYTDGEKYSKNIIANAVIFATGYSSNYPNPILLEIDEYLIRNNEHYETNRDYSIKTRNDFCPKIFLNGHCENTHGPADSALSTLPKRVEFIGEGIMKEFIQGNSHKRGYIYAAP